MRTRSEVALFLGLGLVLAGCGPTRSFDGPAVDAFNGRLTQDGKPVSFPDSEHVTLEVYHETGRKFGIPIHPDGSFKIGAMQLGKYSAQLIWDRKTERGSRTNRYNVPGGFTVEDGKTEYTIELGKGWKP